MILLSFLVVDLCVFSKICLVCGDLQYHYDGTHFYSDFLAALSICRHYEVSKLLNKKLFSASVIIERDYF